MLHTICETIQTPGDTAKMPQCSLKVATTQARRRRSKVPRPPKAQNKATKIVLGYDTWYLVFGKVNSKVMLVR